MHWIMSEVGELSDALMRLPGYAEIEPARNHPRETDLVDVAEEMADVVIMVTSLANSLGINVIHAVEAKLAYLERKHDGSDHGDLDYHVFYDA